ncbi:MAG: hypothetical protein WAW73_18895 [Rhodoferax sp.]
MHLLPRLRRIRQLAVCTALVGLTSAAVAVPEAQFNSAFQQFLQASAGDSAAIEHAAEAFSGLVKSEPTNPVLLAYAGAATAMKATTTWLPWKKMGFAEDGLAQLDKALSLLNTAHEAPVQNGTPGVLEVKFVAANTFLAVPGFMHRQERGAKLLGEVLSSPLLANAPLAFKGTVWLKAAKEASKAQNPSEAKRYLDLIVQQQAPQAAQAQALLKGLAS